MTPDQLELARRLVAHERWEWKAGMLAHSDGLAAAGYHNIRAKGDQEDEENFSGWHGGSWGADDFGMAPDLTDDATGGVLLGVLRADAHDVRMEWDSDYGINDRDGWSLTFDGRVLVQFAPAMAEAAARALLAVWDAEALG